MHLARAQEALDAVVGGARACDLEDETLEFKTDGRSLDDTLRNLAEAVACFANARGGIVVVGVRDATPGPSGLVGTNLDVVKTQRRIFELTEPQLVVACEMLTYHGADFLVIGVPVSPDVHAVGGRTSERVGDSCQQMTNARIARVVADRRGDDWSAEDSRISPADIGPLAMAELRKTLAESVQSSLVSAALGDHELLDALGLVSDSSTLLNAGALLLTGIPGRREEFAYTFRRTPTGALITNEHLGGPLIVAIRRVLEMIEIRTDHTSVNITGGVQLQVGDLPAAVVRESVINAVMHRDYRTPTPISVEHSPGQLTVTSPGPFVSGVTADTVLTTPSRTRNAVLAYATRMIGLAEAAGSGVDRMYTEMGRVGYRPPTFNADFSQVAVNLIGGRPLAPVIRYVATLSSEVRDAEAMIILTTLRRKRTIDARGLAPLIQRSTSAAQLALERLCDESVRMLEPTRETRRQQFPLYRFREHVVAALGAALTYRHRSSDSYDRILIGVLAETETINARLTRLTLGVNGPTASRILAGLVERGIIARTSSATRGPSVAYGPGPKFSKARRANHAHDGTT